LCYILSKKKKKLCYVNEKGMVHGWASQKGCVVSNEKLAFA